MVDIRKVTETKVMVPECNNSRCYLSVCWVLSQPIMGNSVENNTRGCKRACGKRKGSTGPLYPYGNGFHQEWSSENDLYKLKEPVLTLHKLV